MGSAKPGPAGPREPPDPEFASATTLSHSSVIPVVRELYYPGQTLNHFPRRLLRSFDVWCSMTDDSRDNWSCPPRPQPHRRRRDHRAFDFSRVPETDSRLAAYADTDQAELRRRHRHHPRRAARTSSGCCAVSRSSLRLRGRPRHLAPGHAAEVPAARIDESYVSAPSPPPRLQRTCRCCAPSSCPAGPGRRAAAHRLAAYSRAERTAWRPSPSMARRSAAGLPRTSTGSRSCRPPRPGRQRLHRDVLWHPGGDREATAPGG